MQHTDPIIHLFEKTDRVLRDSHTMNVLQKFTLATYTDISPWILDIVVGIGRQIVVHTGVPGVHSVKPALLPVCDPSRPYGYGFAAGVAG